MLHLIGCEEVQFSIRFLANKISSDGRPNSDLEKKAGSDSPEKNRGKSAKKRRAKSKRWQIMGQSGIEDTTLRLADCIFV